MASYGTLAGSVQTALLEEDSCTNDLALDTGNAVYVYAGTIAISLETSAKR